MEIESLFENKNKFWKYVFSDPFNHFIQEMIYNYVLEESLVKIEQRKLSFFKDKMKNLHFKVIYPTIRNINEICS